MTRLVIVSFGKKSSGCTDMFIVSYVMGSERSKLSTCYLFGDGF